VARNSYLEQEQTAQLMPQLLGENRHQFQLFCLDSAIAEDSEVRVIDAFVDVLDLKTLGFQIKGNSHEGRPAFLASDLLKLYLYGYSNRVRSSRRLEREAKTNLEAQWLLKGLQPCYKTIANFRKNNSAALKASFKKFNSFYKDWDLFGGKTAAVDSTKIRAQNSKKNNYNHKKVEQHLDYINKQVERYLKELDELDEQEKLDESLHEQLLASAQKMEQLQQRKQKYEALQQQLDQAKEQGQTQISTTDADARALPKKMNIVEVSYNIQSVVDAKEKLIVHTQATNENDTYGLAEPLIAAKDFLEVESLDGLADKGYDTGSEHQKCAENGIITYVAPRQKNTSKKDPEFVKAKFEYDEEQDHYTCPQGKHLTSNGNWYKKNSGSPLRKPYKVKVYKLPFEVCNACPVKEKCAGKANLKNSKGRPIERSQYEDYLQDNRERVAINKDYYRQRQAIVEHPFGTIKRAWGFDYTLLKGLEKVDAEFALIATCYNLKRVINIFGVHVLLEKLKTLKKQDNSVFLALLNPFLSCFEPLFYFIPTRSLNKYSLRRLAYLPLCAF